MFFKTQMFSLSLAFPDVCKIITPVGPVPIPLPNLAFSTLAVPNIYNHFITAMPVHNLLTVTVISSGNEVSAPMGGIVSNQFIGSKRNLLFSFKIFFQCMPATRMLDMTGQNGLLTNILGLILTPSQIKALGLA